MFAACEYCINKKICEQDENYWMDNCERGDSIGFEPKCCENCVYGHTEDKTSSKVCGYYSGDQHFICKSANGYCDEGESEDE